MQSNTCSEFSGNFCLFVCFVPRKFWLHWKQWQKFALCGVQEFFSTHCIKLPKENHEYFSISELLLEINWPGIHRCYAHSCTLLQHAMTEEKASTCLIIRLKFIYCSLILKAILSQTMCTFSCSWTELFINIDRRMHWKIHTVEEMQTLQAEGERHQDLFLFFFFY